MIKAIIFDITGVIFPYQPWAGERPRREELLEVKKLVADIYNKEKMSKEYLKEKIFSFNRPKEELDAIYNSLAIIDDNLYELIKELSIKKGPDVLEGVMARQIDKNHFLYLNISGEPKEIQMKGNSKSILFNKDYNGNFTIAPYEPEFIELK